MKNKRNSSHKGHYRLPRFIRYLFFSCDDCGKPFRRIGWGASGIPHFVYKTPSDDFPITRYVCHDCEMEYDNF